MTLKNDAKFEEKLTLGCKNDMRNLVNFNRSSGKSENLHFDVPLLSLAYKVLHRQLKVMLGKSFVYNVLAEGMYFFDKSSPSNFNFFNFPLLA